MDPVVSGSGSGLAAAGARVGCGGVRGQHLLRLLWADAPMGTLAAAAVLSGRAARLGKCSPLRGLRTWCEHRLAGGPCGMHPYCTDTHTLAGVPCHWGRPGGTACAGSDVLSYEDVYGFTFKTSSGHSACVFDISWMSLDPRFVCLGFLTSGLGWQRAWPMCRRGRLCSILVHVMLVG